MTPSSDQSVPVRAEPQGGRLFGQIHEDAFPLYVHQAALNAVVAFAERDVSREQAGFLLGGCFRDRRPFVEVSGFLPARHTRSSLTSLTFTHETWAALHEELDRHDTSVKVVGWQHSHPGFGVFLSGRDLFIHRHYFAQPWQVTMVIDPRRQELAFFQWRQGEVVDCGFLLVP